VQQDSSIAACSSVVFFHAVFVGRKKFGTLGYNVPYDFNESDFDISEGCLAYYLAAYEKTQWDALRYLIAEANYGGRETDEFDFSLVRCYVRNFFQEDAISGERFLLAPPLQYVRVPDDGEMKVYTNFVKSLPVFDDPTCFGQHSNADISAQINDTNILLDVLSSLQPATSGAGGGDGSGDNRTLKMVADMQESLPVLVDFQHVKRLKRDDPSALHVFLLQEIVRYNNHLQRMSSNLKDVQKGTKGLVVTSAELHEIVGCVVIGKIPPSCNKCFPSLKPLANWLRDLMTRVTSLREWGEGDYPIVIWMSGFSYPTGFLTAILQTTARANAVSVDMLSWEFTTMQTQAKDISKAPKEGAYIHGMFLEGAAWDMENMCLEDQRAMELIVSMPVVHFHPVEVKKKVVKGINSCPVYMYPIRTGSRERPSYTISVHLKTGGHDGAAILLSLSS
jgi:dynein heavy chain